MIRKYLLSALIAGTMIAGSAELGIRHYVDRDKWHVEDFAVSGRVYVPDDAYKQGLLEEKCVSPEVIRTLKTYRTFDVLEKIPQKLKRPIDAVASFLYQQGARRELNVTAPKDADDISSPHTLYVARSAAFEVFSLHPLTEQAGVQKHIRIPSRYMLIPIKTEPDKENRAGYIITVSDSPRLRAIELSDLVSGALQVYHPLASGDDSTFGNTLELGLLDNIATTFVTDYGQELGVRQTDIMLLVTQRAKNTPQNILRIFRQYDYKEVTKMYLTDRDAIMRFIQDER